MALTLDLDMADHQRKQKGRATRFRLGFIGFWDEVQAYMGARTDLMFSKLKRGGSFRGERWSPFKTATVARGGTHVGPSGRRVRNRVPASQASLIQDTGLLRREIAQTVFTKSRTKLAFGTAIKYAARQQTLRPILFWQDGKDEKEVARIAARWIVHGKK
jgi:hypothetical protein